MECTLEIFVYDEVLVSELLVVEAIVDRLINTWPVRLEKNGTVVSIAEYRKLVGDDVSTDECIVERLQYLEAFCRNVIKQEINNKTNAK